VGSSINLLGQETFPMFKTDSFTYQEKETGYRLCRKADEYSWEIKTP